MFLKKLHWILKRHPFLYICRFWLLSKNSSTTDIEPIAYNTLNDKDAIPRIFFEINERIFEFKKPRTDLDCVKHMVSWLYHHTKVGPGLSTSSDQALKGLLYGKGGVCSDIAQVFNNLCVINGVKVREWGTTSAPFNRNNGGHSFNEIFSKELQKWILIDASWGMLFYRGPNEPISVIEVYELSRNGKKLQHRSFVEDVIIEEEQVMRNYLNSDITPFLICNYKNTTYDRFLKFGRPFVPVFLIHATILLLGKSYCYKFPLDDYKKIFS